MGRSRLTIPTTRTMWPAGSSGMKRGEVCCSAARVSEWPTPPTGTTASGPPSHGHPDVARLARSHNDANVLVLPARFVNEGEGVDIMKAWLDTKFEGGRHSRRVAKIDQEQG